MQKKKLEDLNLLDDFLFGAVISHPNYGERFVRILIKIILDKDIKSFRVIPQMSFYGQDTDRHGARLDVYLEEYPDAVQGAVEVGTIYDIEPDKRDGKKLGIALPKRVRFYRAKIDVKSLQSGADYEKVKNVVIIMLTSYDPFGYGRILYTVRNRCMEEPDMEYEDGAVTLFLYTKGKIGNVSRELKELMHYLEHTTWEDAVNELLREIQSMVEEVKHDKEVSISYMKSYEREWMLKKAGREEGKTEALYTFVTNLIRRGMPDDEISALAECDLDYVSNIRVHLS